MNELERLRDAGLQLAALSAAESVLKDAEIERLRTALLEIRDAIARAIIFQRGGKGPWIPANPDDPLLAIVAQIDALLD